MAIEKIKVRDKNGKWLNTKVFSPAAQVFQATGKYTEAVYGTKAYDDFWNEEERRCLEGYEVGGEKISGRYYFYLNYCPIKRIIDNPSAKTNVKVFSKTKKTKFFDFPDFWAEDYNFFWLIEVAENGMDIKEYEKLRIPYKLSDYNGSKFFCIAKARRKGFSYKTASIALWTYTFIEQSLTLLTAFDKKYLYPKGIFTMCNYYSNFCNQHTDFRKRRLIDKAADGYFKSGFEEVENGIVVQKGFFSEIMSLTFKDNPDAARGKDANLVIVEEAGDWPNFKDAYAAIEPTVRDGDITTGFMIMLGTGGSMTSGSIDFADIFYKPKGFNMLTMPNIWDDDKANTESAYFFPAYVNYVGHMDDAGNSNIESAKLALTKRREDKLATSKNVKEYTQHCTEWAWTPAEAFMVNSSNIFPVAELREQLSKVENTKELNGITGKMILKDGMPFFEVNLNLKPLRYVGNDDNNLEGCIQIWEPPIDNPSFGFYTAGLDPYAVDETKDSESLGSLFIYKRYVIGQETYNFPVAEYTARPKAGFKEYYDQCILLLKYYNASCLYEANINAPKTHFEHKHSLYLLSKTPAILKSTERQNENNYGLKMTAGVKAEIIIYLNDWLREEYTEGHTNVEKIYSKGLLEELIRFNPKEGNFDRFISFSLALVRAIELTRIISQEKRKTTTSTLFRNPLFQK
jgi:hypothetical protein